MVEFKLFLYKVVNHVLIRIKWLFIIFVKNINFILLISIIEILFEKN
jgi:hypothetical protein